MNRRHNVQAGSFWTRHLNHLPAVLHQLELRAEHRLRGRRTEADDDLRLHRAQLRLEPRAARFDLRHARFLVDAPLAPRLPLEMLHGVGDIHLMARNARSVQRLVEHRAGGADKRRALTVFLVARLLADKHHACLVWTGAEDDLRGRFVEIAAAAFVCSRRQRANAGAFRNEWRRRALPARIGIVRAALFRHVALYSMLLYQPRRLTDACIDDSNSRARPRHRGDGSDGGPQGWRPGPELQAAGDRRQDLSVVRLQ